MRIILLCGSLESGKDGVGDYCQRLAGELVRRGHSIGLLSIHESNLPAILENEILIEGNNSIPIMRLSSELEKKDRISKAMNWIESFNPEWISLQFVIFSFHPKGLPFGLSRKFLKMKGGWRWHIMFHELWLGLSVNQSAKYLLWGRVQRRIIKEILIVIKPSAIHTHTKLYQAQLERLGYKAGYLPLFGNIPFANKNTLDLHLKNDPLRSNIFKMVIFGAIHKSPTLTTFANEVAAYAISKNISILLTIVGNSGPEKEFWKTAFQEAGLPIEIIGIQTPENISNVFENSDVGISTYTIQFAEKSGSIAAMREHGLPVLCVSESMKSSDLETVSPMEGVYQYYPGNFGIFMNKAQKVPFFSNLEFVAVKLIDSLNKKKSDPVLK